MDCEEVGSSVWHQFNFFQIARSSPFDSNRQMVLITLITNSLLQFGVARGGFREYSSSGTYPASPIVAKTRPSAGRFLPADSCQEHP
jgi:hypothetical protein